MDIYVSTKFSAHLDCVLHVTERWRMIFHDISTVTQDKKNQLFILRRKKDTLQQGHVCLCIFCN